MTAPMTANDIAGNLAKLARQLEGCSRELDLADRDAVEKREAYTLAYAREFLSSTGSMEIRRYTATEVTHNQRLAAEVADQIVRGLRKRMETIKVRIEVGRSVGAAVRTEMNLAGGPGE